LCLILFTAEAQSSQRKKRQKDCVQDNEPIV